MTDDQCRRRAIHSPKMSYAKGCACVWSPGFSRSDLVSPWTSQAIDPPEGGCTLPAKAGTPYARSAPEPLQAHTCCRTMRLHVRYKAFGLDHLCHWSLELGLSLVIGH